MRAAIVLAGGRSSRLGGVDKTGLIGPDGRSCLTHVVAACPVAAPVVLVGAGVADRLIEWSPAERERLLTACEEPPGSGPARALVAGWRALGTAGVSADWVLVLAGDLPLAGLAMPAMLAAATVAPRTVEGVVARVGARWQWLLALYRWSALADLDERLAAGSGGESLRWCWAGRRLSPVPMTAAAAHDLDTWADVQQARFETRSPDNGGQRRGGHEND
ncbi:MAG: NTP transferase domain-containing protein [Propionibacteriaceae bacterium]|jgi:molybdopterin-guanine dinucleotide biosynthesis protein A|nr:NTP transferase domain-containing protein [Propionibacteriaceae bacterium]